MYTDTLITIIKNIQHKIKANKNIPELAKDYGLKFKQREIKNLLGKNAEKFLKLKN